jgi:hypothetical protein
MPPILARGQNHIRTEREWRQKCRPVDHESCRGGKDGRPARPIVRFTSRLKIRSIGWLRGYGPTAAVSTGAVANSDARRAPAPRPFLTRRLSPRLRMCWISSPKHLSLWASAGVECQSVGIRAGRKLSALACLPGYRITHHGGLRRACEAVLKRGRPIKHPVKATGF